MTISIIIPVYNSEKWLRECLTSIRCQTYRDYEVIIVNDGSEDNSQIIIDEFTSIDTRFISIKKSNEGVSAARNDGLEIAEGEWITFIDSDDCVEVDFLEKLIAHEEDGIDFIQSGVSFIDGRKQTRKEERLPDRNYTLPEDLFVQATLPRITGPMAKLYKLDIIQENNITFDRTLSYGEDRDFNLKYITCCHRTKSISYIGYNYSVNVPNCLSSNKDYEKLLKIDLDYWDKLQKLLSKDSVNLEIEKYLSNALFNFYNDRLSAIAKTRNEGLYRIIKKHFSESRFGWLTEHFHISNINMLMGMVYRFRMHFLAYMLYKYISRG